jgi:hypothetical protein
VLIVAAPVTDLAEGVLSIGYSLILHPHAITLAPNLADAFELLMHRETSHKTERIRRGLLRAASIRNLSMDRNTSGKSRIVSQFTTH